MTWQLFGHSCEFRKVGENMCLPFGRGAEMAVVRDEMGVWAFDNICPHRGARIFDAGRSDSGEPVCRYHGRHIHRSTPGVRVFPTVTIAGWVLVGGEGDDATTLPDWSYDLGAWANAELTPASVITAIYGCHWTVAVENALDFDHVASVHADTLAPLKLKQVGLTLYANGASFETFESGDKPRLDRLCEQFVGHNDFDYAHLFAGPHACLASTRGTTFSLQHYYPMKGGDTTTFVSRLYARKTKTAVGTALLEQIARFNGKVFDEDARICARVPHSVNPAWQHLGPNEARVRHFREKQP